MMYFSLPFIWILANLLIIPSIFYLYCLDYLNLPRGVFWIYSMTFIVLIEYWKGRLTPLLKVDRLNSFMLIFLAWSALSGAWAWQSELTWMRWSFLFCAYLTFIWVRSFNDKQKSILLWVLAIHGLLLSIIGVCQFYEIEPFSKILQTEKPAMTMGHRNVGAEYVLICMGAALSQINSVKGIKKTVPILIVAVCLVAIALTRCRGVMLGIILATFCSMAYFCFIIRSKWIKIGVITLIISLSVLSIFVFQAKLPGLSESFSAGKMESIRMRMAHYSNTLVLVKENFPTGVGLGNFAIQYSQFLNSWLPDKHYSDRLILRNTHSDPLECLAELGPFGLLLVILVLWKILFKADKSNLVKFGIWWAILAQLFNACVNFPFQVIQTQMAMAVILGCFIHKDAFQPSWSFSLPKRNLIKVSVSLCLFYNLFHHYQRIEASHQSKMGYSFLIADKPKLGEPYLRRSLELEPRQVDHIMLLAYCLRALGRTTESSSLAENVLGIFPHYLPAYNLIGINSLKINDLNRAVRAFELSYQNQKFQKTTQEKLVLSYEMLGMEFRKRGFTKEARILEYKLRKVKPNKVESYLREAFDLIHLKQYSLAEEILGEVKKLRDDEKSDYIEARIRVGQQKWISALEAVERGLKKSSKDLKLLSLKSDIQKKFLKPKTTKSL